MTTELAEGFDFSSIPLLISIIAVIVSAYSAWQSRINAEKVRTLQTEDLKLKFFENIMEWGAASISELAQLETIFTIERPGDF